MACNHFPIEIFPLYAVAYGVAPIENDDPLHSIQSSIYFRYFVQPPSISWQNQAAKAWVIVGLARIRSSCILGGAHKHHTYFNVDANRMFPTLMKYTTHIKCHDL